jgi:hypothetical protein
MAALSNSHHTENLHLQPTTFGERFRVPAGYHKMIQ